MLLYYWEKTNDRYPIKVDGIVGPKKISAIQEFQRAKTGWVDGRVDPGGGRCLRAPEAEFATLQREVKAYAVRRWRCRSNFRSPSRDTTLAPSRLDSKSDLWSVFSGMQ